MTTQPKPVLIVHGGAGLAARPEHAIVYRNAVGEALARGLARIGDGARAAVVAAVVSMEESALLNAGRGAALAEDGTVSLDAGFMDGQTRRFGGVAGVRRTATPVRIAELLASDGEFGRLLIGDAADAAARTAGIAETSPEALVSDHARERARLRVADSTAPRGDTVGAVALDAQGHVAAAVSTGGLAGKRAGRVGDSPIVGAGFWADDRIGAAVTTGIGEALMRHGTARRCIELVASGASLREAARRSLDELGSSAIEVGRSGGIGGIIALTRHGEIAIDHDTAEMASAWGSPGEQTVVRSRWHDPVA